MDLTLWRGILEPVSAAECNKLNKQKGHVAICTFVSADSGETFCIIECEDADKIKNFFETKIL